MKNRRKNALPLKRPGGGDGGKQKRVKRPPNVEGMDVDEFIRRNADPIWLHQNEMWEELYELEMAEWIETPETSEKSKPEDVPF